jgi:hypothetical protein
MKRLFNRGGGRRGHRPCLSIGRAMAAAALCLGLAVQSASAVQPAASDPLVRITPARAFLAPELDVKPDLEPSVALAVGRYVPMKPGAQAFLQRAGGEWELRWDRRTDRPNLLQGSGIALLPGKGNSLTNASLGLAPGAAIDLATVEARLSAFVAANEDLLQTRGLEFRLDPDASTPYGDGGTHWFIELAQYAGGVRVDRAHLFFRLSHGNIVQFGEELVAPVRIDTRPSISSTDAFKAAWQQLAFPAGARIGETVEAGELLVLPTAPAGEPTNEAWNGPSGAGYAHRLAWRFVFRIDGDDATWEVLFDAHAKSVIAVRDLTVNAAATVTGGVYPTTNTDPEVVVPMPFASVTNGTAKVTDAFGVYDYSGGSATVALSGKYFKMADNCGSISLANSTDGNLALGTSGGTDCTTPGVGGAGNTHASRTGFYHLTNINRKAVTFFPANTWLASTVTANMNVNQTCNANWNGSTLNFFKSGGGCSNTGEIAAVFLHEWGHGMDTNTGGAPSEKGSGEAVGDTFAFLETKDACIGKNFIPGQPCYNCDATCTGVRDVKAFSTRGAATIAKPSTITATTGAACARWSCPYLSQGITPYQGPMGYEGHCESYIASSANWDLTQALIDKYGATQGWQQMDKIWYGSLVPSKSAYQVVSGGTCNINATVNGCGSSNWYTVFLAADDDDGNLANGTPNACRIWDAFDAHGIACGTRPVCSADAPDFGISVPNPAQSACAPGSASYTIDIASQMGFTSPVALAATGLPAGATAGFVPNPVVPGNSATLTLSAGAGAAAGSYTITVAGTASGSPGHSVPVQLNLSVGVPATPTLTAPANGATGTARQPVLSWSADPAAVGYTIEIASDAAFTSIVQSGTSTAATWTPTTPLAPMTTYYWRVRANSPCGNSAVSAVFAFTTGVTFPEPYCTVAFPSAVEPITRVKIGGIDNPSSATVGGSPALEDFTGIIGSLTAGANAAIAIEGNTAGNFTTYVSAYIDWNRNGTFDAGEKYDIGTIANSTGTDGKQATGTIAVPAGALAGNTRLRVIKKYSSTVAYPDACNTAGYGQAEDYTVTVAAGGSTYTVGGTVSGLAGSGLTLKLNGGSDLAVSANGAFTFPGGLASGTIYAVTVGTQPTGQTCTVANGSGTIGSANVTNVAVTCAAVATYTVGGTVSGLTGTGLTLKLNGDSDLAIAADGAFTFVGGLTSGSAYAVTVGTQPTGQTCTVANGSGTIGSANVTNVAVTCAGMPPQNYTIGGRVTGLTTAGLVLQLNGGQTVTMNANGLYAFAPGLPSGATYEVTVLTQPAAQTCTVANASGTMGSANVTNVDVACAATIVDLIFTDGFEGTP